MFSKQKTYTCVLHTTGGGRMTMNIKADTAEDARKEFAEQMELGWGYGWRNRRDVIVMEQDAYSAMLRESIFDPEEDDAE